MGLKQLIEARAAKMAAAQAALDAGNGEGFDALVKEVEDLDNKISELEARALKMTTLTSKTAAVEAFANRPATPSVREDEKRTTMVTAGEDRFKSGNFIDFLKEAVYFAKNKRFIADGPVDAREKAVASMTIENRAALGLNETIDAEGGILLDADVSNDMMPYILSDTSLPGLCTQRNLSSNRLVLRSLNNYSKASSWTGAAIAYWLDEANTITPSAADFDKIEIHAKKVAALYYSTEELDEDQPALQAELLEGAGMELSMAIGEAIVNGLGTAAVQGILSSKALLTQAIEADQALVDGALMTENLLNMLAHFPAKNRSRGVWLYNPELDAWFPRLNLAVGTGGVPVYLPPNGLSAKPFGTIFGMPMLPCEHCQAPGTVGDIVLADMSQYILAMRGGIKKAASIHVAFVSEQTAWRLSQRVGGHTRQSSYYTPRHATSGFYMSPFITLAARV